MNSAALLLLAAFGGSVCGVFFFGGLWWTIRRGLVSGHPAAWFLGSLLVRSVSVVMGFHWLGQNDWMRTLTCLAGFLGIRIVIQLVWSPPRWSAPPTQLTAAP